MKAKVLIRIMSMFCASLAVLTVVGCDFAESPSKAAKRALNLVRLGDVPHGENRFKLQFLSEEEGWLGNGKTLWRTTDGGKSWLLAFSGEHTWDILDRIEELHFINAQTGWMLVSPDSIYKTKDAGFTWTQLRVEGMVIRSVQLLNDGIRGWAAGEMYRPISRKDAGVPGQLVSSDGKKVLYPALFRTEDGGTTWSPEFLPSGEGRLLHLSFLDADHGWATSDGEVFYLDNSANRWRAVDYSKGNCPNRLLLKTTQWDRQDGDAYYPVAMYFVDSNLGWLSFQNGYVAKTTDGGKTWCDLLDPKNVWPDSVGLTFFSKFYFHDETTGCALGADGTIRQTNDGGANWKVVNNDTRFDDMCFPDRGTGWAVGKHGLFRISL